MFKAAGQIAHSGENVVVNYRAQKHSPGVELEPGVYVVHAGGDGVTGTATIRLRGRRHRTS